MTVTETFRSEFGEKRPSPTKSLVKTRVSVHRRQVRGSSTTNDDKAGEKYKDHRTSQDEGVL